MSPIFRDATGDDVAACLEIRGRTRENALSASDLEAAGATLESWRDGVREGPLFGRACCAREGSIVGYCYGDRATGEVVVLAVLPEHEGNGIGRALLEQVVSTFRTIGIAPIWLGAARNESTRSHGFYRRLGWVPTGELDARGDRILHLES